MEDDKNKLTSGSAKLQGELWGSRAKDWAELQEPKETSLFESILSNVNFSGGKIKLLDVGCGSGLLCKLASDKGVDVTGFDASISLLQQARKRLPGNTFVQGDMEELPFEENSFDVITGVTSFQFAQNPSNALKEACRVLKDKGQFIIAIWGPPDKCEAAKILSVMKDLMPPPAKPPAQATPLYAEESLENFVNENGFNSLKRIELPYKWEYKDTDEILRAFMSAGAVEIAIRHSGEEKVKEALRSSLKPFEKEDGSYSVSNTFIYLLAEKG